MAGTREERVKEEVGQALPKGITRCSNGRLQARYTFEGKRYSLYGYDAEELGKKLIQAKREREEESRKLQVQP